MIEKLYEKEKSKNNNYSKVILAKILIPDTLRKNCLNYLKDEMNITHGSLFPDYSGAVEICKYDLV